MATASKQTHTDSTGGGVPASSGVASPKSRRPRPFFYNPNSRPPTKCGQSSNEDIRLALLWAHGALSLHDITRITRRSASSAYAWLALRLRDAIRTGMAGEHRPRQPRRGDAAPHPGSLTRR
jgi:hypothetical protein